MTILTDLSEVLIYGLWVTNAFVADDYDRKTADQYWQRHLETFDVFMEVMRGHMSEEDYWRKFFKDGRKWPFGILYAEGTFSRAMRLSLPGVLKVYQEAHWVDPETQEVKKPRIIVVSDHIESRVGEIKKNHPEIWEVADDFAWSFQYGKVKRDKGFFTELLNKFSLDPGETVLVDDSPTNCSVAAAETGIHTILFDDAKRLRNELSDFDFIFI